MNTKLYKFDATFRKKVADVMDELGLYYASSYRQTENGTLTFYDPQANCFYAFYESGYCRRFIPAGFWGSQTMGGHRVKGYQLNKTIKQATNYGRYTTIREMANPNEQLGIVVAAIASYRKNH